MNNISPKQEQSFPEACRIRKGLPKVKMTKNNFEFFGITNFHDLKDRFRFEFQEGIGEIRPDYQTKIERKDWNLKEIFHNLHAAEYIKYDMTYKRPGVYASNDGFELKTIRAMIPCFNVLDAFYWANVANNAGTQIATANDEQYISEKNPLNTREYIVKNGQPFKAWKNGEIISYKKGDKVITLPFKTDIRLSLFMPELERFVYFTLKSTSYYDRLQMQAHLNGIQFWANTLNGGNAAGIPLLIYRKEQAVTWNKPDGSAQQTKQWLVNIEADPEWVRYASKKMSQFAFGEGAQKMLSAPPPAVPLVGEYDPSAPDEEGEFEDLGDQPETSGAPAVIELNASPVQNEWLPAQITLLITERLAKNKFNARGMLDLSDLPFDVTDAELLRWGKMYRAFRDEKDGEGKEVNNSKLAAEKANANYNGEA